MISTTWYDKTMAEVFRALHTSDVGLGHDEATRRLKKYGPNKLPEHRPDNLFWIFLRQFQSPLVYILLVACVIVFLMGELTDGTIILIVLLFNALLGTVQEGRAQNTLLALKKLVDTKATVLRGGQELLVSAVEIVPGDIIVLQEGEKVPADARVIAAQGLKLDEAALTGESFPVHKIADVINSMAVSTFDQKNMVFKGTLVLSGHGTAVVVATGLTTMIGSVAKQLVGIDIEVPLKVNLHHFSKLILIIVGGICAVLFPLGLLAGKSFREMFKITVSLAVSVIPEGLPIVVTLILVFSAWRMSKRNVLVKRLYAVEALGQAGVIAIDKTGTITKNELMVTSVYADDQLFEVGGHGYKAVGDIKRAGAVVDGATVPVLSLLGTIAALSAGARVMLAERERCLRVVGDPTEAAMLVFAQKLGLYKDALRETMPKLAELPFDYMLKYHAVVNDVAGKKFVGVTGAPEAVLERCSTVWRDGEARQLSAEEKAKIAEVFLHMLQDGQRVIACAQATVLSMPDLRSLSNLTFVGFCGMRDDLAPGVVEAVQKARAAGIRIVMITGDHEVTAQAIARAAGIYQAGDLLLLGKEIENLSLQQLAERIKGVTVFARVAPAQKLSIINALRLHGDIVAMTGDGVNDAPALAAADLGVGMGKIGTEVAKEAADIVLLDDNFASVIVGVEEGRGIHKTLRRVILYFFTGSISLILIIFGAIVFGLPIPLLTAQILWLNFVANGLLDDTLAMEPQEEGLLQQPFEKLKKYLVDGAMVARAFIIATPLAGITLFIFSKNYVINVHKASTIALAMLCIGHLLNAWNCRSEEKSIFEMSPLSNKYLLGASLLVLILLMAVVYNPTMQKLLRTIPLDVGDWLVIVPAASVVLVVEEVRKGIMRWWQAIS